MKKLFLCLDGDLPSKKYVNDFRPLRYTLYMAFQSFLCQNIVFFKKRNRFSDKDAISLKSRLPFDKKKLRKVSHKMLFNLEGYIRRLNFPPAICIGEIQETFSTFNVK